MFNNTALIVSITKDIHEVGDVQAGPRREHLAPEPCLLARLPSIAFLQREAEQIAPKTVADQLKRYRTPSPPTVTGDGQPEDVHASETIEPELPKKGGVKFTLASIIPVISLSKSIRGPKGSSQSNNSWKPPQSYEILRAIERKDIMFLMEVRDRAFECLLQRTGDATPLLHAMRIENVDMAIILLGAFSRYINHLQDEDMALPDTKRILKLLRTNLKIAIDYGLQKSQKDLMASFLQTLIMSEGDAWVTAQISDVALALRAGTTGKPVHSAEAAVRSFATRNLGKADLIASLEDYIANATADLVMMAAWSMTLKSVRGEPIPSWYFARDDRVYKAFVDRLDKHKSAIDGTIGRRLRWQLRSLRKHLEGRNTTYRSRVESLAKELDEGDGV